MGIQSPGDAVQSAYAQSLIQFKSRQLSRKPGLTRSDEEDLRQELTLHLWRQLVHYDPERGSVNTFLSRVAEAWAAGVLRDRGRLKRGGSRRIEPLDEAGPGTGIGTSQTSQVSDADHARRVGRSAEPQQATIERQLDVAEVVASLPPDLQDLCRRLTGGNEARVARDLGGSRRKIRAMKQLIRDRLERAGLDAES